MPKIFGNFSLPIPEATKVTMYPLTKTSRDTLDNTVLDTITGTLVAGDIAIIDTVIEEEIVNKTAYMWDGEKWVALNGEVEADKIVLTDDILMAGNYTQVGNLTKTNTGTATFETKGLTLAEALQAIFTQELQPTITSNPSVDAFSISAATSVEAGTKYDEITGGAATFKTGSYTYGPSPTGVAQTSRSLSRVCVPTTLSATGLAISDDGSFTDNNGGNGFVIGDQGGDNTVSSLYYTSTVNYSEGQLATTNLSNPSSPEVKIPAGSASKNSSTVKPFRKYFYGSSTTVPSEITSDVIRGLTNSTDAAAAGTTFTVDVVEGAQFVCIAYPSTIQDVTSIADENAFGTLITGNFTKTLLNVEGANNYTAIEYKIFTLTPDAALGANTYTVTI